MLEIDVVYAFFLIFTGAAIVATLALFTRQPLIIGYILLGMLIGPYGLKFIENPDQLAKISEIGIIFLLFLIGLDMQPQNLWSTLKKATTIAIVSSVIFASVGYGTALALGYSASESLIIGAAMMFSSTIIAIKLLPTTVLHHKHTGELMVGILLLQDLIAIVVLLALGNAGTTETNWWTSITTLLALPLLLAISWQLVRLVFLPLLMRFDRIQEYIFLLAIGWCLGIGQLAHVLGLSYEIGAFIAGISIASNPISLFIAQSLKPLRDFFLVLFFFTIGAAFNITILSTIWFELLLLSAVFLALKPLVFRFLLGNLSESKHLAWDVGFRLGQNSEFSILIGYLAATSGLLSDKGSFLIQGTAILTFALSSYIVVFNFPNPIAIKESLRRD